MEAKYLLENNTTIRKTAQKFNRSKTTIHKDFEIKHLNGGQATKLKYRN